MCDSECMLGCSQSLQQVYSSLCYPPPEHVSLTHYRNTAAWVWRLGDRLRSFRIPRGEFESLPCTASNRLPTGGIFKYNQGCMHHANIPAVPTCFRAQDYAWCGHWAIFFEISESNRHPDTESTDAIEPQP